MMKQFKLMILTAGLLFGGIGSASAVTLSSLPQIGSSNITYCVENGVATIYGHAESGMDKAHAARHVAALEGVDRIINLVTYN